MTFESALRVSTSFSGSQLGVFLHRSWATWPVRAHKEFGATTNLHTWTAIHWRHEIASPCGGTPRRLSCPSTKCHFPGGIPSNFNSSLLSGIHLRIYCGCKCTGLLHRLYRCQWRSYGGNQLRRSQSSHTASSTGDHVGVPLQAATARDHQRSAANRRSPGQLAFPKRSLCHRTE